MTIRNLKQYREAIREEMRLSVELGALINSPIGKNHRDRQAAIMDQLDTLDLAMESYRHRCPSVMKDHVDEFARNVFAIRHK